MSAAASSAATGEPDLSVTRIPSARVRDRPHGGVRGEERAAPALVARADEDGLPAACELGERALHDHAAVVDDRDVVADLLDLVEQVRGEQHRASLGDEAADHAAKLVMPAGSRPLVGSSRISSSGSASSARATPSRWRIPSE